ncbi:MAG: N-acetylmuramoyl-L-alanine amidase [Rhodobacteraceae bacterium]|nr:N-acetylmuramoyl-L-alanine amidase [Paracoccaceae bacterium]MCY4249265.1 N-acetylmuramoyl-L-alanine amidase [Paracoccaceae bacterium]
MSINRKFNPVWFPSPNYSQRRDNRNPSLIVIHYTAMATYELALERLCSPIHEVSSHYLITEKGKVYQLVQDEMRAWHAGAGSWKEQGDINSISLGIELANLGNHPYSLPQILSLEATLRHLINKWDIPIHNILGHSDMAVGRKLDPGRKFDWRGLALSNLSIWSDCEVSAKGDKSEFITLAESFGYSSSKDMSEEESSYHLLDSFRSRFRPWASGELNEHDIGCLRELASISERFEGSKQR